MPAEHSPDLFDSESFEDRGAMTPDAAAVRRARAQPRGVSGGNGRSVPDRSPVDRKSEGMSPSRVAHTELGFRSNLCCFTNVNVL